MFNFFKKKDKTKQSEVAAEAVPLTAEEQAVVEEKIQKAQTEVNNLVADSKNDSAAIAKAYEELGLAQAAINSETAIASLEESLAHKQTIGDGYKKLMSIYNLKRAEAARNGDDAGIELWMGKMDEMRQIAKKVTIIG